MFSAKIGAREGPARMLRNFLKDTSGATAIEYALIAAGIPSTRNGDNYCKLSALAFNEQLMTGQLLGFREPPM